MYRIKFIREEKEILVEPGQRALAGETILARLP